MILEFVELDDFVAHLKNANHKSVRCEIESETGAPRGEWNNAPLTANAVVTAVLTDFGMRYIVKWTRTILITDSLSYRMDKTQSRDKMFENFARVQQEFETLGFTVLRGQWKLA